MKERQQRVNEMRAEIGRVSRPRKGSDRAASRGGARSHWKVESRQIAREIGSRVLNRPISAGKQKMILRRSFLSSASDTSAVVGLSRLRTLEVRQPRRLFVGLIGLHPDRKRTSAARFARAAKVLKPNWRRRAPERDAALAKLKEVEERLAGLSDQISLDQGKFEDVKPRHERERIAQSTEEEIAKLTAQAPTRNRKCRESREERTAGTFTAEQSVRLAEEI